MTVETAILASVEAELSVIGGLMQDASALPDLPLQPADFYRADCREAFRAILGLHAAKQPVDLVTVAEAMEQADTLRYLPRGLATLASWIENTPGSRNVPTYAGLVRGKAKARAAQAIGARLAAEANDPSAIDTALRDLLALDVARREWEATLRQAVTAAVDLVDDMAQGIQRAVPTGLSDLDQRLAGWHDGDLVVIGARPAVGKTAFLLGSALRGGVPCGVMSAEQPREQIGMRAIAHDGRVSLHRMRLGSLGDDDMGRLVAGSSRAAERPVWVNDQPGPTTEDVVRQARRWKHEHGIKALYVDYLQRIRVTQGRDRPPHERIGEIAMTLKETARELCIPVVVLAQVNREVEKRPNKRPGMADLKDSGTIEQEADVVLTLYRDEVYNPDGPDTGIAEVSIAKNRHGPTGLVRCAWLGEFATFQDLRSGYDD